MNDDPEGTECVGFPKAFLDRIPSYPFHLNYLISCGTLYTFTQTPPPSTHTSTPPPPPRSSLFFPIPCFTIFSPSVHFILHPYFLSSHLLHLFLLLPSSSFYLCLNLASSPPSPFTSSARQTKRTTLNIIRVCKCLSMKWIKVLPGHPPAPPPPPTPLSLSLSLSFLLTISLSISLFPSFPRFHCTPLSLYPFPCLYLAALFPSLYLPYPLPHLSISSLYLSVCLSPPPPLFLSPSLSPPPPSLYLFSLPLRLSISPSASLSLPLSLSPSPISLSLLSTSPSVYPPPPPLFLSLSPRSFSFSISSLSPVSPSPLSLSPRTPYQAGPGLFTVFNEIGPNRRFLFDFSRRAIIAYN